MSRSGDFPQIKGFRKDPETALLLAVSRCEPDQSAVRTIAGWIENWDFFLELADRHSLRMLAYRALEAAQVPYPAAIATRLWAASLRRERANRLLMAELERIVAALEQEGIACLPYKGPTLALLAYGDLAAREFGDLDVLVRPAQVRAACEALESLGYRHEFELPELAEQAMHHAGAHYHLGMNGPMGVKFELHWRTDADFCVERDDDGWWSSLPRRRFASTSLRTFAPTDLMLVLLLHGSKHHWSSLNWLADIAELARRESIDWKRLDERAHELRAKRRVDLGLLLAKDLFDAPVPDVSPHPAVANLAAEIAREAFAGETPTSAPRLLARDLVLFDGACGRVRHAAQVIFAPTVADWTRWRLPGPLAFLYVPLRLARLAAKYLRVMAPPPRTRTAATPRTPPRQPHSTG